MKHHTPIATMISAALLFALSSAPRAYAEDGGTSSPEPTPAPEQAKPSEEPKPAEEAAKPQPTLQELLVGGWSTTAEPTLDKPDMVYVDKDLNVVVLPASLGPSLRERLETAFQEKAPNLVGLAPQFVALAIDGEQKLAEVKVEDGVARLVVTDSQTGVSKSAEIKIVSQEPLTVEVIETDDKGETTVKNRLVKLSDDGYLERLTKLLMMVADQIGQPPLQSGSTAPAPQPKDDTKKSDGEKVSERRKHEAAPKAAPAKKPAASIRGY